MSRVAAGLVLLAAACHPQSSVAIRVQVCGWLCGNRDGTIDPNDFSGVSCAVAARVRLLGTSSSGAFFHEQCIDLSAEGQHLSDVFGPPLDGGAGGPIQLDPIPQGSRMTVEVALYGPETASPCPADAPWIGLGRSAEVTVPNQDIEVDVPLGCHETCEHRSSITLNTFQIESGMPAPLAGDVVLGDIFPYESLTSTDGMCSPSTTQLPHASFKPYPTAQQGPTFISPVAFDLFPGFGGCVAARIPTDAGVMNACLLNPTLSSAMIPVFGDSSVLANLTQSVLPRGAHGALAVLVADATLKPYVGANVYFTGITTGGEASYLADDWVTVNNTGGTTSTGVALVFDAPAGPYTVVYNDSANTTVTVNAGGTQEPDSVTTTIAHP
jgi:hypothetical protein